MECYSFIKRNELANLEKTWRNFKCTLLSKKRQSKKGYLLYDSNSVTFWKRQNHTDSKKIRVVRDCEGGEDE